MRRGKYTALLEWLLIAALIALALSVAEPLQKKLQPIWQELRGLRF